MFYLFSQHRGYDEDFVKNLREMDKLYQENSRHKAEAEQLKEQNKQLEQGLKEVIENLKKYTPGEVPLPLRKFRGWYEVSWPLYFSIVKEVRGQSEVFLTSWSS